MSFAVEMLELHRYKHVDWRPSPVVALAASVDGSAIAAGRGNGSIEIWIVSPGSVGWHCELTIPGKKDASLSCLLWCPSSCSRRGRLFSGGLDGFIAEWDLLTLRAKEVLKSYGGSVWQMALQPSRTLVGLRGKKETSSPEQSSSLSTDAESDSKSDDDENSASEDEEASFDERNVAVGCDDGCVRLFAVKDGDSFVYRRSLPRVQGRILSVAWSLDAAKLFSGGSDGCIRCWDTSQLRELYRITAGLGGAGSGATLCIWSIITLRDGTVVSGDSSGSTQFWDGKQGALLQAHTGHKADVLALATSPNHQSVFAAGADGQVAQYQLVPESRVLADAARKGVVDIGLGMGERWVFLGSKRTHTHDVNALVVARPQFSEVSNELGEKSKSSQRVRKKVKKSWMEKGDSTLDKSKGICMLVSGGNDAKLFTYPATAFLAFHPHDVCPAPQRTPISLALNSKLQKGLIMMAQHEHQVEVWKININSLASGPVESGSGPGKLSQNTSPSPLGKRKLQESSLQDGKRRMANGHMQKVRTVDLGNGPAHKPFHANAPSPTGKVKGSPPELLARIKCKSVENITCSAISQTGELVAFSDQFKPRLFELEQRSRPGTCDTESWSIKKRRLPNDLPPAHSMVFCGSSRLLLASPDNDVLVVDTETPALLHRFAVGSDSSRSHEDGVLPLTILCTSLDERWLATSNSRGNISIFNLETFREHWHVPPLDGSYVTAACFHPGNSGILIVSTNANVLYMLDVEERKLGEWSRKNGHRLPRSFLEFPGGIQGLSVSPSQKRTMAIAYSSKAMCLIDFQKPVPNDESGFIAGPEKGHLSNGALFSGKKAILQNGSMNGSEKNFVLVPFKDPVFYMGHVADSSILVIEKPWIDAVNKLPPPVYRHFYGT